MSNITSKLVINGVEYELKDTQAEVDITVLETRVDNLNLEGADWELKSDYTSATETLNLTIGKVE